MKNPAFLFFVLLISLIIQPLFAQEAKDCEEAIELCGDFPLYYGISEGIGIEDQGIAETCLLGEYNSIWFRWIIREGGFFTFILTPETEDQDLDFVVFKLGQSGTCAEKTWVRCMASGENIGVPPESNEPCQGPTGLAVGETDYIEQPGCQMGDNNFLAPIEAEEGEQYALLVNDFSNSGAGFTLDFGGTAIIGCPGLSGVDIGRKTNSHIVVFPSPSTGKLTIAWPKPDFPGARLEIVDAFGRVVWMEERIESNVHKLDMHHLPMGNYMACLHQDGQVYTRRFALVR